MTGLEENYQSSILPKNAGACKAVLTELFRKRHQPKSQHRIGAESEKFGVHRRTLAPLNYEGNFGVLKVLEALRDRFGWNEVRESEGLPLIALTRGGANLTLEPAAQLELSGAPHRSLHNVWAEQREHLQELQQISQEMDLVWLTSGFHPLAKPAELSWVPKLRYPIMREYLPTQGHEGLNMMQRTATVQANFDYESEEDAMLKVTTALKLSPLLQALFANSPFYEGKPWEGLSRRGEVWRFMDPSRSGLIPALWNEGAGYEDYVNWALDAGMFLFKRDGRVIRNTGQSFRDFVTHGFEGHEATAADFELHITTLFPEVRLKNTIEVRPNDGLDPVLGMACVALWTGLLYDQRSLEAAAGLVEGLKHEVVERQRATLVRQGLAGQYGAYNGFDAAEQVVELARQGLSRHEPGSEVYLDPVSEMLKERLHPADRALSLFRQSGSIVEATSLEFQ